MTDATATLQAFHQTGSGGDLAGFRNKDSRFNKIRIGRVNYGTGFTTSARYETGFAVEKVCNRTKVVLKRR